MTKAKGLLGNEAQIAKDTAEDEAKIAELEQKRESASRVGGGPISGLDGVVEAESRSHARFGTQRALDLIRDHRHQPARKIIETLYAAIVQFCGQPQHDDITAVVVKVLPDHVAG